MRFVMREQPKFLTSAAVIDPNASDLSVLYILPGKQLCLHLFNTSKRIEKYRLGGRSRIGLQPTCKSFGIHCPGEWMRPCFQSWYKTKLLFTATLRPWCLKKG
jgi:hypothetical protein